MLFHSVGEDGGFAGVWMRSFEYNLITGASGDFWTVYPRDEKAAFLKTCTLNHLPTPPAAATTSGG